MSPRLAVALRRVLDRPSALAMALGACFSFGQAAAELALALAAQFLFVRIGASSHRPSLPFGLEAPQDLDNILVLLVLAGFVRAVLYSCSLSVPAIVEQRAVASIRTRVFAGFLAGQGFADRGEFNRALGELATQAGRFVGACCSVLQGAVLVCAVVLALLYGSPTNGAVTLATLFVIGLGYRRLQVHFLKMAAKGKESSKQIFAGANRVSRLAPLIRAYRLADVEFALFDANARKNAWSLATSAVRSNLLSTMTAVMGLLLVAALVKVDAAQGRLGPGMISFLYLLMRLVQALNSLSNAVGATNVLRRPFDEVAELLDAGPVTTPAFALAAGAAADATSVRTGPAARRAAKAPVISVSGLSFGHEPARPIFSAFDLGVDGGEHLLITGRSGLGKSTLFDLLTGALSPWAGRVEIDGLSPARYFEDFRDSVGVLGVDCFVFPGTVRSNVLYGSHQDLEDADVWRALEGAGLAEKVRRLPAGLDHAFDGEESLSAGERQRLCLARALVRRPVLLLLDEATSHLDPASERLVFETLVRLGRSCTILAIAHRTSGDTRFDRRLALPDPASSAEEATA